MLAISVIVIAIARGAVVMFNPCTSDALCNDFAFGF